MDIEILLLEKDSILAKELCEDITICDIEQSVL